MKSKSGFTLVELIVVLVIFALLLSFGVPAFGRWKLRHDVEAQTAKLYGDMQLARMKAYSEKADCEVWWGATNPFTSYAIRSDGNGDGDFDDPVDTNIVKSSRFSVTSSTANRIGFNARGFCNTTTGTLRIASSTGAANDCVKVSRTRIKIGKWDGANCVPQ